MSTRESHYITKRYANAVNRKISGILHEARGEFVILFGFRPKLVKIVKQNRTDFFSQIKKITNSENDRVEGRCQ